MAEFSIYDDIARRTGGDIYIGIVGPVRTGKSTFIKRFMETLVLPHIEDVYVRERAKDELPQSGSGRTIMTSEPKFVPEDAVCVTLGEGASLSVRLIDCVGYMIPGAIGRFEGESERMVSTPWFDHELRISEAAELGTAKVIREHSTIGLVVTTDDSICDIPRSDYEEAEERVVRELQEIGKPFVILINCAAPDGEDACALRESASVPCVCDPAKRSLQRREAISSRASRIRARSSVSRTSGAMARNEPMSLFSSAERLVKAVGREETLASHALRTACCFAGERTL